MPPPFMPPPGNPGEAPLGMPPMPFMPYMSQPMPHQLPLPGIPDAGFKPPAFPYQNSLPPRPNTPLNGEKLSELVRVPESVCYSLHLYVVKTSIICYKAILQRMYIFTYMCAV